MIEYFIHKCQICNNKIIYLALNMKSDLNVNDLKLNDFQCMFILLIILEYILIKQCVRRWKLT